MLKIAIVEDEPAAIELLKEHLSHFKSEHDLSYDVQVFRDGAAFLDGYAPIYDIVFMDIEMPNLDGLTLCRLIKEDPVLRVIPVAIFSSLISKPLARKCESVGADAQFAKPDLQAISDKMYELIENAGI